MAKKDATQKIKIIKAEPPLSGTNKDGSTADVFLSPGQVYEAEIKDGFAYLHFSEYVKPLHIKLDRIEIGKPMNESEALKEAQKHLRKGNERGTVYAFIENVNYGGDSLHELFSQIEFDNNFDSKISKYMGEEANYWGFRFENNDPVRYFTLKSPT